MTEPSPTSRRQPVGAPPWAWWAALAVLAAPALGDGRAEQPAAPGHVAGESEGLDRFPDDHRPVYVFTSQPGQGYLSKSVLGATPFLRKGFALAACEYARGHWRINRLVLCSDDEAEAAAWLPDDSVRWVMGPGDLAGLVRITSEDEATAYARVFYSAATADCFGCGWWELRPRDGFGEGSEFHLPKPAWMTGLLPTQWVGSVEPDEWEARGLDLPAATATDTGYLVTLWLIQGSEACDLSGKAEGVPRDVPCRVVLHVSRGGEITVEEVSPLAGGALPVTLVLGVMETSL